MHPNFKASHIRMKLTLQAYGYTEPTHQSGMSFGGTKNPPTNPATALNTGEMR